MKALLCLALFAFPAAAFAQVVPTTPTKFTTRPVGGATATNGATITPSSTAPAVRHVTYLTLSPLRQWTSTDGKSLMGKLIAYEESVSNHPVPQSAAPITTQPTVLRDGKARLLVDRKAYEVPLERLGPEEQKFIQQLQAALAAKP